MKCIICGKLAVSTYPKPLCKEHFLEYYKNTVKKTIEKYKMFSKDDKILVAVSGGKDSAALAYVLYELGYDFEGLYINLGIPNYSNPSEEAVKKLFKLINKKLHIVNVKDYGVKVEKVKNRPVCSVCGTIKRYIMNKFAYENNFDVLATAHNLSDEAAFYLMNIKSGQLLYLVKQEPVLPGENKFVKKVKPLYFLTEKENMLYALINKLPVYHGECPNAKGNPQIRWKKILYKIEAESPGFMRDLVLSMQKLKKYINYNPKKQPLYHCKLCGYPTSSPDRICAFCKIRLYFQKTRTQ